MEHLVPHDEDTVPENAEIILLIGGQLFQCERRILVENSPYFDAMFNSGMVESNAKVIDLKGGCPRAMEEIIRYLKTGHLDCTFDFIPNLLETSAMYQFASIKNRCIAMLRTNLSISNCLGIMFLAAKFSIGDLLRETQQVALWDFEGVLQEPEFMTLSTDRVIEYLSNDGLNVRSEDLVLNSILNWMRYNEEERIQNYEDLFSAVRFSCLDFKSLKNAAHDPLILKCHKMKRLVHEIWKIKFLKHVQSNISPLSVSPLSSISPVEEEISTEASARPPSGFEGPESVDDCTAAALRPVPPLQLMPNINVDNVIAHRLLSACPRSLPMVPALAFCNTKDKSEAPVLIYYDVVKRKPVKIGNLRKAFHSCGEVICIANGFKACAVGNCVYVIGGEFQLGHGNWNNCVWKYNTFIKSWSFVTNLQNPRRHHQLCTMDDSIYLIGGIGRFRVAQDTVQQLEILSGNVSDVNPMLVPVTSAAVVAHQGKLYIFESLIYRYNAESNSWSCLRSVSLPHHGFHSALTHPNGIYLVGRCSTQLSLYCPEYHRDPYHKATFSAVGSFRFPTENACIVGNKIYSFSSTEFLTIETYDIESKIFNVEYINEDESFLGPKYQHGCFALTRYS